MVTFESDPSPKNPAEVIFSEVEDLMDKSGLLINQLPQVEEGVLFITIQDVEGEQIHDEETLQDLMNGIGVNCDSTRGLPMEIVSKYGGPTGIKITLDN